MTDVKAVFDMKMTSNNNLSVTVDDREIGYNILVLEPKFRASRTTSERCSFKHHEKTSNLRHRWLHKKPLSESDQRQLLKIVSLDRRGAQPQRSSEFSTEA